MDYVFVIAVIAILVGVFVVSTGRGGELAFERPDSPPLELEHVSATDVALLRPPTALWGYNMQVTDEAFERIARAVRDRDVHIAYLQRLLAEQGQPEAPLPGQDALPLQYAPLALPLPQNAPEEKPEDPAAEEMGW